MARSKATVLHEQLLLCDSLRSSLTSFKRRKHHNRLFRSSQSFEALEKEFGGIVHQFDEADLDRTLEEALLRVFGMTDEDRDEVGRRGRAVVVEKVRRNARMGAFESFCSPPVRPTSSCSTRTHQEPRVFCNFTRPLE